MLTRINNIIGCRINATDGELGKVKGFYSDDEKWTTRYLIADTGNCLPGRQVLISPEAIGTCGWVEGGGNSGFTDEETRLYNYYGRPVYWY